MPFGHPLSPDGNAAIREGEAAAKWCCQSRRRVSIVDSTKVVLTARCSRTTNPSEENGVTFYEAAKGREDQPEVQAQVMYVRPHAPKPCKLF